MAASLEAARASAVFGAIPHIPAHVARERVYDFDFYKGDEFTHCPHRTLSGFHQRPDIFYTPRNGGHWVVSRMDVAGELLQAPHIFSNDPAVSGQGMMVSSFRRLPLDLDPPEHLAYRRILNGMFSPAAVRRFETQIRSFARELVATVADRGECEFMSEIAKRYPTEIFLNLLGIPRERRLEFIGWVEDAVRAADPALGRDAYRKIASLMEDAFAQRKATPGDDLLSELMGKDIDGRSLDEGELVGIALVLFIGGLDTVVALLSFIIQFLAEHPDHVRQLIAAPGDLESALEELIRRHGVSNLYRHVAQDTSFHGVDMKAGERVLLLFSIFGVDDRNASDPLEVDFTRPVSRHLTFGGGPHRCLGSHLARLELRVFLQEWFARIPEFGIRAGADLTHSGGKIMQLDSLPLAWPVTPSRG